MKRGTRREIRLAVRAIRAARTHLSVARCGLVGEPDEVVLHQLKTLGWSVEDLLALLSAKPVVSDLVAALRKGGKPGLVAHKLTQRLKRGAA